MTGVSVSFSLHGRGGSPTLKANRLTGFSCVNRPHRDRSYANAVGMVEGRVPDGSTMTDIELSVIVPCYNEEAVLPECHRRLTSVLQGMNVSYECVYIDDGSRDNTWLQLRAMQQQHPGNVVAVALSRNFGHQPAVSAGLTFARGKAGSPTSTSLRTRATFA